MGASTEEGTQQLHERWLEWVHATLGRDPVLGEVAARAAVDSASRQQGFNSAAEAARSAWTEAAERLPGHRRPSSLLTGRLGLAVFVSALVLLIPAVVASQASEITTVQGYAYPCSTEQPLNATVCVTTSPNEMQYAFGFFDLPEYSIGSFGLSPGDIARGDAVRFWLSGANRVIAFEVGSRMYTTWEYTVLTTAGALLAPAGNAGLWVVVSLLAASLTILWTGERAFRGALSYGAGVTAMTAVALVPPWTASTTWILVLLAMATWLVTIPTALFSGVRNVRTKTGTWNLCAVEGMILGLVVLVLVAR